MLQYLLFLSWGSLSLTLPPHRQEYSKVHKNKTEDVHSHLQQQLLFLSSGKNSKSSDNTSVDNAPQRPALAEAVPYQRLEFTDSKTFYLDQYQQGKNSFKVKQVKMAPDLLNTTTTTGHYGQKNATLLEPSSDRPQGEEEEDDFSKSDAFHPENHFLANDSQRYNVSGEDVYGINQPLEQKEKLLSYKFLRRCPHGRQLLLVSLLENVDLAYWEPRASGKLQLYLPNSIQSPQQPNPPKNAFILHEVVMEGEVVTRKELLEKYRNRPISNFTKEAQASRFNAGYQEAVRSLVGLALSQETFDSCLSLLVAMKEFCNRKIFIEAVLAVISARDDVGYVVPSIVSIQPEDFFPSNITHSHYSFEHGKGRVKRQIFGRPANVVRRLNWNEEPFKTYPDWEPESQLWYFREDPLINANHQHWHMSLSNTRVPPWHPSNSGNMDRRGEMFYFMHKQILCRFNNERLSVGLPLTVSYDRRYWAQPLYPGYDSKLTLATSRPYPPRPAGAVMSAMTNPGINQLIAAENSIREAIRTRQLYMPNSAPRLGYGNGIDYGISPLGDAIEALEQTWNYGNLHNDGHTVVARMHGMDGLQGVMGNPNAALRDPIFYRWHKYVDDLFREYKISLPPYTDIDLDFRGVTVTQWNVQSEVPVGGPYNILYTLADWGSVTLNSLDFRQDQWAVDVQYRRLNHIPFNYNIQIISSQATQGLGRIFLIPAGISIPTTDDVTQVAIEMDRFLINLVPGTNNITRPSALSPFIAKSPLPLLDLQLGLLRGSISQEDFNFAGCGWPQEMTLPRGTEEGMTFRLLFMISQLLPADSARTADWARMSRTSWSWCGVRRSDGTVPDSRPMGFPLDRAPPGGDWRSLLYRTNGQFRDNFAATDIVIRYDPVGTTSVG